MIELVKKKTTTKRESVSYTVCVLCVCCIHKPVIRLVMVPCRESQDILKIRSIMLFCIKKKQPTIHKTIGHLQLPQKIKIHVTTNTIAGGSAIQTQVSRSKSCIPLVLFSLLSHKSRKAEALKKVSRLTKALYYKSLIIIILTIPNVFQPQGLHQDMKQMADLEFFLI